MTTKQQFDEKLIFTGEWNGSRCRDAANNPEGDVIACAAALSVFNDLIYIALHKKLSAVDIELVAKNWMKAAGMKEVDQRIGGKILQRV